MRQARPALRGDGQSSSLRERILRLRLAFIFRPDFPKAEKYTHPRGRKAWKKGKRNQFEVMEDALTLVLVIVLCLLLKPLISAILRGLGSSEHRRDR